MEKVLYKDRWNGFEGAYIQPILQSSLIVVELSAD